ncbi:universal stress protein [Actinoplanes sp. NPDC023714]|uniref:universal stress protein n=1 Tax=Actinoplanes sp. NPDC023714 TaxID=3154322 RepID=UPI0033FD9792
MEGRTVHKKIIVGYDGSSCARTALDWALREASRTAEAVELVHADERPASAPAQVPELRPDSHAEQVINAALQSALTHAARYQPMIDVTATTVAGHAATVLVERSRQARLIVLGARGHSAVTGLLGSVSAAVSAHAHCPVVVVRGESSASAPVVAGVDGSPAAAAVLTVAAAQAARRKVPLRVIRAWKPVTGLWEETAMNTHTVTDAERQPFDSLVAVIRDAFPDLEIDAEAVVEHPAAALTAASATAQLVVAGSRGHGAVRGLLIGSVSQHLLRHSACTVVVVHGGAEDPLTQGSCTGPGNDPPKGQS